MEEVVATYLTGVGGIFLASVITLTIVKIVLGRGLMDQARERALSRIMCWKAVLTYALI